MATSTNTDQAAPRGALSTTDQLEPNSYADDPNDGVEADARTGSSDTYSLDASDPAPSGHDPASQGKDGLSEALKAERRRSNNLEKDLRGLRQQLTRFSEINPEEYSRLQEAERQKQLLEQQVELRERQMEEASAKKVATVAAERDGAQALVLALRKERLLERAFSEAEGRTGGDGRGTFFDVFKGQLGESFRLSAGKDGSDVLEPLDSQGQPLLGDDGRPLSTADFLDQPWYPPRLRLPVSKARCHGDRCHWRRWTGQRNRGGSRCKLWRWLRRGAQPPGNECQ
ncbi:hypothetical protein [Cyanobium sp. L1E-Cus]|uniref:hypothetical protein n=1 Tax=Cyanobium sp. L1E-Cus TaxID=2823714 RepID=UPI0020CD282E|nr:hypothetical protein [Cyanobium sp. L1E-Cus]MCP9823533.1 hypothetical protein [Cyanobium sp. L1E-Cus]